MSIGYFEGVIRVTLKVTKVTKRTRVFLGASQVLRLATGKIAFSGLDGGKWLWHRWFSPGLDAWRTRLDLVRQKMTRWRLDCHESSI